MIFSSWKLGPIGLDVGERHVCAAQLMTRGDERRLVAATRLPRGKHFAPTSEKLHADEAASVLATLQRQGFRGTRLVVGLPRPMLMSGVLDLPPRGSGAPLEMIARTELARANRATPEAMESTWWELPAPARASTGTCAMAVGCTHAAAELLVSPFDAMSRTGRAEVLAIDARCVATSRACEPLIGHDPGAIGAVLELGWSRGELTMLVGATPMYERPLDDAGLCRVHARLMSELSVDPDVADYLLKQVSVGPEGEPPVTEEAGEGLMRRHARAVLVEHLGHVADEVRVAFAYAQGRYPSSDEPRLLVVGEGAQIAGADAVLNDQLGLAVRVVRPADVARVEERKFAGRPEVTADPAIVPAMGLACWRPAAAQQTPEEVAA